MANDDAAREKMILQLLHERGAGKTICPSEVARAMAGDDRNAWEPLMEPVRETARRMERAGSIEIMQHGHPVDAATAKGPIRFRLR